MSKRFPRSLVFAVLCAYTPGAHAAQYHVATDGSDASSGSSAQPWRTIAKAANTLLPGDSVTVREGGYDERVTTVRGGTSESTRIVFQTAGLVTMRGWIVNHPYVTVRGFDITGHSGTLPEDGYVRVNDGASWFELLSCKIRDGVGIARTDMVFTAPNLISTASGGFLAAGFAAGQSISVTRATNVNILNTSNYVVASVSDTAISVSGTSIVDDGPTPAYITGSRCYGIYFRSGTQNAVVCSNVFSNLSYRYGSIAGRNHLFEKNTFERNNGWDVLFFVGTNHVFRGNWFRNNGWGTYQPSADLFDNWPTRYENIHFTNNYVQDMIGVIHVEHNSTVSGPMYVTRNIFIDIGGLYTGKPDTTIEHNTFLRVASRNNAAVALARHPVNVSTFNNATNAIIRNNIFVDCGQRTFPYRESEMGWYEIKGPSNSVLAEGNFVSGGPPGFNSKIGWPEDNPMLNGGDPGFVNINDPLGPDGFPFTDDDGLRPHPKSKLVLAGAGGRTVGAYEVAGERSPILVADRGSNGRLLLRWPQTVGSWSLESAPSLALPWSNVPAIPVLVNGQFEVAIHATNSAAFYRLTR